MEALQSSFEQIARFVTRKVKSYRRANEFDLLGSNSNSGKGGNGVSINVVNRSVVMSLVWLFLSLFTVIYGFRDCWYNSYSYKFECKGGSCIYTASSREGIQKRVIERADLKRVDTVRLDKDGQIVDFSTGNKKSSRRLGYSVQITYSKLVADGSRSKVDDKMLLVPKDMGRRSSRTASSKLFTYIDKTKDKIDIKHSNSITLVGLLCIVFGLLSSVVSCILGQWSDPEPRRVKKSS